MDDLMAAARWVLTRDLRTVNVPELVRADFTSAAQERGFIVTNGLADAVLVFRIEQYGFVYCLWKRGEFPFAIAVAELRNREGKVYWRERRGRGGMFLPGVGASWDEYGRDPQKLRADWEKVIADLAKIVLHEPKK